MKFRVDLETYRGPLDLLLYLVRKHEVDVVDIPIARIADQFLRHISVLEQLDVNAVGDFLEMASTLIEIKSRMVLPRGGEVQEEIDDPRHELVRRLLEYKRYKDAASMLEERNRQWQNRFPRLSDDLPPRQADPADQPIHEVEMWDLVSAFGRILRETDATRPSNIVYDETPISVYMERIYARLRETGEVKFTSLFEADMHKSVLIGIFLAILELVRHHKVRVRQEQLFGEIDLIVEPDADEQLDLDQIGAEWEAEGGNEGGGDGEVGRKI